MATAGGKGAEIRPKRTSPGLVFLLIGIAEGLLIGVVYTELFTAVALFLARLSNQKYYAQHEMAIVRLTYPFEVVSTVGYYVILAFIFVPSTAFLQGMLAENRALISLDLNQSLFADDSKFLQSESDALRALLHALGHAPKMPQPKGHGGGYANLSHHVEQYRDGDLGDPFGYGDVNLTAFNLNQAGAEVLLTRGMILCAPLGAGMCRLTTKASWLMTAWMRDKRFKNQIKDMGVPLVMSTFFPILFQWLLPKFCRSWHRANRRKTWTTGHSCCLRCCCACCRCRYRPAVASAYGCRCWNRVLNVVLCDTQYDEDAAEDADVLVPEDELSRRLEPHNFACPADPPNSASLFHSEFGHLTKERIGISAADEIIIASMRDDFNLWGEYRAICCLLAMVTMLSTWL